MKSTFLEAAITLSRHPLQIKYSAWVNVNYSDLNAIFSKEQFQGPGDARTDSLCKGTSGPSTNLTV